MNEYQIIIWLVVEPTPLKKYGSQLGWLFPIYGNIKSVPNHQPVIDEINFTHQHFGLNTTVAINSLGFHGTCLSGMWLKRLGTERWTMELHRYHWQ